MKRLIIALIAVFGFALTASAFDAVHGEKYYTVKVKGAYKSEAAKCKELCASLQKDGVMAFCVKGMKTNETFAGIYETKARAEAAAAALKAKYNFACIVTETKAASAVPYQGGMLVNVPSGIWLEAAGETKKIFSYGRCVDAKQWILENKVSVSPSGKEIVFFFNGAIHKVELGTGTDKILASGISNPGAPCRPAPVWSPDGSSIAFVEEYGADTGAGIKVMKSDGAGLVCLLDNRIAKRHVASLAWRPGTNMLYYIETGTDKRVTVGGTLYSVDMKGKTTICASPSAGKEIDRHFKFQGKSIIISENTYAPGLDDNYASNEKSVDLN